MTMDISYDPAKNALNITERDLPFDRAGEFDFQSALVQEDVRKPYPERRFVAIGWLEARLHVLCFSPVLGGIRIISFRKANSREQRAYERTQHTTH